jgi:hypothetical protein
MLGNAHVHLAGFSETRALLQFGAVQQLQCNETRCTSCSLINDEVLAHQTMLTMSALRCIFAVWHV